MDELLTIDEMAAKLKVGKSWLYRRTMPKGAEKIPHLQVGKYLRFDEKAVMAWLKTKQEER